MANDFWFNVLMFLAVALTFALIVGLIGAAICTYITWGFAWATWFDIRVLAGLSVLIGLGFSVVGMSSELKR